jgi:hypothetical protein
LTMMPRVPMVKFQTAAWSHYRQRRSGIR